MSEDKKDFPKSPNEAAQRKGMTLPREALKEGDPGFLSGEVPEDRKYTDEKHIEEMRKTRPNYPFMVTREDCQFCNNILKDATAELVGQFKIVIKDKNDPDKIKASVIGPTVEGCPYCGRNISITPEKGIEFLE